MNSWKRSVLGMLCNIRKGFTPSTGNSSYWGGDIDWLSIADMNQGKYISSTNKKITEAGAKNRNIIKKGTLLMSFKLTIGKLGILNKDMYTNEAICNFQWNTPNISTEFMYYYLSSINIKKYGSQAAKGITLNNDTLNAIPVFYPSFDEQEKIANFLSVVDKKIELMEKKYEKVIQFKKSILEKIFKKELNFKNNEWITIKLKDIGQFYRGHSYNSSNVTQRGLLVLRSNNIKNNKISLSEQLQFVNKDCKEELKLKKGDIVICMSNGSRNLVGKTGQYMGNYDGNLTVGAFCSIFRPKLGLSKFLFQTESYKKQLYLILAGTNINNLKNSDLENFSFEIPIVSDEIDNICSFLDYIDSNIYSLEKKIEKIKEFKKYLLQQMFV